MPWCNNVVLMGRIHDEPVAQIVTLRDGTGMSIVNFTMYNRYQRVGWRVRHNFIRVKLSAGTAEFFQKKDPKPGDYLQVIGRIETAKFTGRDGKKRSSFYVAGESIEFLWGPPKTFTKGHLLVPKDEVDRLRALTEGMSPWTVPGVDLSENQPE